MKITNNGMVKFERSMEEVCVLVDKLGNVVIVSPKPNSLNDVVPKHISEAFHQAGVIFKNLKEKAQEESQPVGTMRVIEYGEDVKKKR